MIKKDKKRTFTLIELLVVIAILAVLATVAIVSYGVFTKKAKESNDIYLVKQMNIVLEASEVLDGKNKTMTDALEDVFDRGYNVTKLTPTSSNYNIVWDSINDRMVLLNDQREIVFPKENMSANKDLFVMISSESDMEKFVGYSYYLRSDFLTDSNAITINNGLDVGNNENITSVSYEHTTGEKQTSIIRTIKGNLVINGLNGDEGDTIKHYGFIRNLSINSIGNKDCYHEFGFVGSVDLFSSGKFIAEKTSIFHQTKDAVESVVAANNIDRFFESKIGAQYDEHYFENGKCVICNADKCIHKWDDGTISKEPTCTVVGTKVYKCELCGKERDEEISAKGHTIVVDEKKEPTCTETGLTKGEHCSECGTIVTKQDTLSALNHDWDEVKYEWSRDYKTCTAKRICKRDNNHIETEMVTTKQTIKQNQTTCDIEEISKFTATFKNASFIEQVKDNIITKAKGTHTFSWVIDKDSTCKETGLKHEECGICHYKQKENTVIDKKAHTEVIDNAVDATCTKTGLTEGKHCSECNEIIVKQNEIPMKEHDWNEGQIIIQPTCNTTGEELFTCKNCNATKKETLSKTNDHDWNEWLSDDDKTHSRVCKNCDKEEIEQHSIENDGTCSKCGYISIKNGIVNGYYYVNNELYTGRKDEYDFEEGKLVICLNSKEYIKESTSSEIVGKRIYNYVIKNMDYLTKEVIINGDNSSYDSLATINIIDESGKNYKVKSVVGNAPFNDLLEKSNWTIDEIYSHLANDGGKKLLKNNYFVENKNALTAYSSNEDDPDNYDIFIPNLCADSEFIQNYLMLNDCDNIEDYYSKYQNDTLLIKLIDYMKLVYGKGYTLTSNNGNFEYKKSYGNNYTSNMFDGYYINVFPDSSTGLPKIQLLTENGDYMTAITKIENNMIVFENFVIDANSSGKIYNGKMLTMLKFYAGENFYVSISKNIISLHNNSLDGSEICRFEIDNENNLIKTYIKEVITDANGLPFSLPSSGKATLVNNKISLTGAFNIDDVILNSNDLNALSSINTSSYVIFEKELIELIIKNVYKGTISVESDGKKYSLNDIPMNVFNKSGNTYSASFECIYSRPALDLLKTNIFNGIDYAGATYTIILEC